MAVDVEASAVVLEQTGERKMDAACGLGIICRGFQKGLGTDGSRKRCTHANICGCAHSHTHIHTCKWNKRSVPGAATSLQCPPWAAVAGDLHFRPMLSMEIKSAHRETLVLTLTEFPSICHCVQLPVVTTAFSLLLFHIWLNPIQTPKQPIKCNDATPTVTASTLCILPSYWDIYPPTSCLNSILPFLQLPREL